MIDYKLELPDDFDDYAWEVESKGWFNGAIFVLGHVRYRLFFYDPTRLSQDIEDELEGGVAFLERNLLVVKTVDRNNMEKAIEFLAKSGKYIDLKVCDEF
jgi:hypothetical protein